MQLSQLGRAKLGEFTSCPLPCTFLEYTLVQTEETAITLGHRLAIKLWSASNSVTVETEQMVGVPRSTSQVYPLTSLVAEFGGALGLFLGFSFMTLWDLVPFGIKLLERTVRHA